MSRWSVVLAVAAAASVSLAPAPGVAQSSPAPFTVQVHGNGRPMILIPGLTNTGAVWESTVAEFARDHQVHVLSLAGFGGTPPVATDSGWLERQRDAIVRYVRAERLEKPILVGHSLGGVLSLWIAATEPDLPGAVVNVDGLPFLGATMDPNATVESVRPQALQMRTMMSAPGSKENYLRMQDMQLRMMTQDTAARRLLAAHGRESDMATIAAAMFELFTVDLRPLLPQVKVPVLNLHAWAAFAGFGQTREGADRMFAQQYATLPAARTRIHDTSYHFIMYDAPEWMHTEMREFLQGVGR